MPDTNQTTPGSLTDAEIVARSKIGRHVTYFALAVTGTLAVVAITVAIFRDGTDVDKRFVYVKDILTIVLPLIGTWVGTVLAFYFSRENFNAAAKQATELVRQMTPEQRLQSISVTEVMLDMSAAETIKLSLPTENDAVKFKLKADIVDAILEKNKRNRLPIVDTEGRVLYVLHRSFIDKFLVTKSGVGGTAVADATLQDMLAVVELKSAFTAFAVLGKNAKLIAAKEAIDGNPNCSDVFITSDGTKGSKAIGWITNVIVQEKSVA